MNNKLQTILIVASILFIVLVIRITSKKKISYNYTLIWIIFSFIIFILSIFPNIVINLATFIGIELPVNALFLTFIFILILSNLMISIHVSKNEEKIIALTQEIGLLKNKIDKKENLK